MKNKRHDIGTKIKECREATGLSQAALARKIGVTPDQISNYEANKRNMNIQRFIVICEALHVEMVEMLN